jgi:hypothetical protein
MKKGDYFPPFFYLLIELPLELPLGLDVLPPELEPPLGLEVELPELDGLL